MEAADSLFECLEQVPDPRRARGVRHPFQAILRLTLLGLVCGHHHGPHRPLRQDALAGTEAGFLRNHPPHATTISRTLAGVPYEQLQGALTGWVARVVADQEVNASVDGKWAKQSEDKGGNPLVMVNVLAHDLRLCQWPASEKRYEPGVLREQLAQLFERYPGLRLLTMDALYAERECQAIVSYEDGTTWCESRASPRCWRHWRTGLPWKPEAETGKKAGGSRSAASGKALAEFPGSFPERGRGRWWRRRRWGTGEVSRERWYLLTSLSSRRCGPLLRGSATTGALRTACNVKDAVGMRTSTPCPSLGEVYATLVNTALNALRLEGWFPLQMSMPLRAKTAPSAQRRPSPASAVNPPDFAIVLSTASRHLSLTLVWRTGRIKRQRVTSLSITGVNMSDDHRTISFAVDTAMERRLKSAASTKGISVEQYCSDAIFKELDNDSPPQEKSLQGTLKSGRLILKGSQTLGASTAALLALRDEVSQGTTGTADSAGLIREARRLRGERQEELGRS